MFPAREPSARLSAWEEPFLRKRRVMQMHQSYVTAHAVIGALSLAGAATAGFPDFPYGDFVGDNVEFLDVTEGSPDPGPFYDFPSPVGDSLVFPATGFQSESLNGGMEFLDSRLTMTIDANPGELISSISVFESGSYVTTGVPGRDSVASVSAIAFVDAGGDIFSDSFNLEWEGDDSGNWQASFTISFDPTDSVQFTLDNQLFTSAVSGFSAYVDKQNITVTANVVPAPGVLALLGLSGLAVRRRRT
jgi:hypothetical protein